MDNLTGPKPTAAIEITAKVCLLLRSIQRAADHANRLNLSTSGWLNVRPQLSQQVYTWANSRKQSGQDKAKKH